MANKEQHEQVLAIFRKKSSPTSSISFQAKDEEKSKENGENQSFSLCFVVALTLLEKVEFTFVESLTEN